MKKCICESLILKVVKIHPAYYKQQIIQPALLSYAIICALVYRSAC